MAAGEDAVLTGIGAALSKTVSDLLSDPNSIMERYMGDLEQGWVVLLVCGCVVPILLSFFWMVGPRNRLCIVRWYMYTCMCIVYMPGTGTL